jgi:hypothetical protein
MSLGGSDPGPQQSNVTQTDIPEWLKPYTITNVESAQDIINRPYEAWSGEDIADFTTAQEAAQKGILNLVTPTGMADAESTLKNVASVAQGQKYDPTSFSANYAAGQFTPDVAKRMMDPYMQAVVDTQKKKIQQEYQAGKAGRAAQAVQAGAFGGGRYGAQEAVAESEMLDRMAEAQATGAQKAYESGMGQFRAEEAAKQQQAQLEMTADERAEMSKQFAANFGQQGQELAMRAAQSQADVAKAQSDMDQAILKLQNAVGKEQQDLAQAELDAARARFESARDYDRQNVAFMNSIIRGTPVTVSSTSSQYSATNPYAQAVGTGLAGLQAYNLMG